MRWLLLSLLLASAGLAPVSAQEAPAQRLREGRLFELRVLYPAEGKLPDLHARFRDHTARLFARHGFDVLATFTAGDAKEGDGERLVVLLATPGRADRERSWANLVLDPEWQRVKRASDRDGRLVEKVQDYLMRPSPDCPAVRPVPANGSGQLELVTHAAVAGDEPAGHERLRREHAGAELLGSWELEERRGNAATLVHLVRRPAPPELVLASAGRDLPGISALRAATPTPRPGFGRLTLTPTPYSPGK